MGGVDFCEEPRIDGNAVAADANSREKNVHARVGVSNLDGSSGLDPEALRNHRKLVREGDVHIPVGVLHDLNKFSCHVVCEEDLAPYERFID